MNSNIMEALSIVLSELQRSSFTMEELSLVSELLSRQGFSPQEISAAIDLLQQRYETSARVATPGSVIREPAVGSWRILTKSERMQLSPEAEQLVLESQRTGILQAMDVDTALLLAAREEEHPVTKERMQEIVTEIVMEKPPSGSDL